MSEEKEGSIVEGLDTHESPASKVPTVVTQSERETGDMSGDATTGDERVVLMLTSLGELCIFTCLNGFQCSLNAARSVLVILRVVGF